MTISREPTTTISSRSAIGQAGELLTDIIRTIPRTSSLAWTLAAQNLRARYRTTFLGIVWTMIPPLAIAAGFALANRARIFSVDDTPLPYLLYVLIGTTVWQVFAEALESPYSALDQARAYITRVNFPREAVVLSKLLESCIAAGIKLVILIGFAILLRVAPAYSAVLLLVSFMGVLLLGYAIGLWISPLLLLFSDLVHALRLIMAYGLFLAPVVYPPPKVGLFHWVVILNPVTPFIMAAREGLVGWQLSYPQAFYWLLGGSFAGLFMGLVLMRVALPILIERMLVGGR